MTTHRLNFILLSWVLALVSFGAAFVPRAAPPRTFHLEASLQQQLEIKAVTAAAFIVANVPAVVCAVEEDYEYGAVDAPIGIAVAAGVLAILTALLPIALRGGEEAFEEIRERDKDTFGSKNADILKSKRKK